MNRRLFFSIWLGTICIATWFLSPSPLEASEDCRVPPRLAASRPGADGPPTRVSIGTYLIDLRNVDDSNQSFEADLFYLMTWSDPRLVSDDLPSSLIGCTLPLSSIWSPQPELVNERDIRRRFPETASVDSDGTVRHVQRVQGEFTARLHLRAFPFDSQNLYIDIVARNHTPEQVEWVLDKQVAGREEALTLTDWTIGDGGIDFTPRYMAPQKRYLAQAKVYVTVQRDLPYYFLKIFLPLTLIICMSWAVFWIHPKYLPPQVGVSTSAVLTLIAFQFSLGYMLPKLEYLTRADRFLIGSTFLVFGAFGETLVTSYLAEHGNEERALAIDRVSRWLYPAAFIGVALISFVF